MKQSLKDFKYNVCRVCQAPHTVVQLSSLFEGDGDEAQMFEIITSIKISTVKNIHQAMICAICSKDLKKAFVLRQRALEADHTYFKKKRIERKVQTRSNSSSSISDLGNSIKLSDVLLKKRFGLKQLSIPLTRIERAGYNKEQSEKTSEVLAEKSCNLRVLRKQKGIKKKTQQPIVFKLNSFVCEMCNRRFGRKSSLTRHKKTHSGDSQMNPKVKVKQTKSTAMGTLTKDVVKPSATTKQENKVPINVEGKPTDRQFYHKSYILLK